MRSLFILFALMAGLVSCEFLQSKQSTEVTPIPESTDPSCRHDGTHLRCVEFIKNHDGDTITVDVPGVHPLLGRKISVRILGIDTPETTSKRPCEKDAARIAKNLLTSLLRSAKRIDLENVERDKYFRILADVSYDGKSVSDVMLKNHLAVPYDGGTKTKPDWCRVLQSLRNQNF